MWEHLQEHRGYLADHVRTDAYRRALRAVVRPGDAVLDLGSGTGVLGLLALEAGAGTVYSVDGSSMIALARGVVRDHGTSQVVLLQGMSTEVELPEPVQVVVADQMGPFAVGAGLFPSFADARRRHLAPGGVTVPASVSFLAAPLESAALREEVGFWDTSPAGIDTSSIGRLARHTRSNGEVAPEDLLAEPALLFRADPADPDVRRLSARVDLPVRREGVLDGICAWFDAELAPGVSLTNSPVRADRMDRVPALLPIAASVPVGPGDVVELELEVGSDGDLYRWTVAVRGADGQERARSRHSTAEALPLTKDDLARTRPDRRPRLTPTGAARATVLALCDGERTLDQLQAAVLAAHPDAFADEAEAAGFVVAVLRHDAR